MGLETFQVGRVRGQAAAGGNDGSGAPRQLKDGLVFEGAKGGFAVLLQKISVMLRPVLVVMSSSVSRKLKMQLFRDQPADRSLSRAHKTDEREIDRMSSAVHGHALTHFEAGSTPQFPPLDKSPTVGRLTA